MRKSWAIYAVVIVGVCLIIGIFVLPYFATRPLSKSDLLHQAQERGFTGYPPSVYVHTFLSCVSDAPCAQTDEFHLDQVPSGCCVLMLTNGDGRGMDEVRSYEVFLNGQRVLSTDHSRNAQGAVKLQATNTLKAVLSGAPHSKVFILLAYDPSGSK